MVQLIEENVFYLIETTKSDESNGCYRNVPQIWIRKKQGEIKYQIHSSSGTKLSGELMSDYTNILESFDEDGRYMVDVWVENDDGLMVTDSMFSLKFIVDTGTLKDAITFEWHEDSRRLTITGRDDLSGVAGMYYQVGNGIKQYTAESTVFVKISEDFSGEVAVTLVDVAGNRHEATYRVEKLIVTKEQNYDNTHSVMAPVEEQQATIEAQKLNEIQPTELMESTPAKIQDKTPPKIIHLKELEEKVQQACQTNYRTQTIRLRDFDVEKFVEDQSPYDYEFRTDMGELEFVVTDYCGNQTIQSISLPVQTRSLRWIFFVPVILLLLVFFAWKLRRRGLY